MLTVWTIWTPAFGSLPLSVKLSPLFEPLSVTASAAWSLAPTSIVSEVTLEVSMLSTVTVSRPEPMLRSSAWMPLAVRLPPASRVDLEVLAARLVDVERVRAVRRGDRERVGAAAAVDGREHAGRQVHRDRVVAGAALDVVARAARDDDVVAVAAVEDVACAVAAGDRVVAAAAVDVDARVGAVVDDVVAAGAAVDGDRAAGLGADDDDVGGAVVAELVAPQRRAAGAVVQQRVVPVAAVRVHGRENSLVDDDRVVSGAAVRVDVAARARTSAGGRRR